MKRIVVLLLSIVLLAFAAGCTTLHDGHDGNGSGGGSGCDASDIGYHANHAYYDGPAGDPRYSRSEHSEREGA